MAHSFYASYNLTRDARIKMAFHQLSRFLDSDEADFPDSTAA
jgi:hypothetical protein